MLQSPHLQINLPSFTRLFCLALPLISLLLAYLLYATTIVYFYQYIIYHCTNHLSPGWTSFSSQDCPSYTLPHKCLHCHWMFPSAYDMFAIDLDWGHTPKRESSIASTLSSWSPSPKLQYIELGQLSPATAVELEKDQKGNISYIWSPSFSPTFPDQVLINGECHDSNSEDGRWAKLHDLANTSLAAAATTDAAQKAAQRDKSQKQAALHNLMNKVTCEAEEITCKAKETASVNVPVCPTPDWDVVLKFLKFIPPQNPIDSWGSKFGWTGSDETAQTWPTPPTTPLQGDQDHPPLSEYSGEMLQANMLIR